MTRAPQCPAALRARRLNFERLEDRHMLAGDVTAFVNGAGDAIVSGDGLNNDIAIRSGANPGELTIEGIGTRVNGGPNDTLTGFSGDLVVALGPGNNRLSLRTLALGPGQDFRGTFGDGDDRLIIDTADFGGAFNAAVGDGADKLNFDFVTFDGPLTVDLGGGAGNRLNIRNGALNGAVTVQGGNLRDNLLFTLVQFNAPSRFTLGGGDDDVRLTRCDVNADMEVICEEGNDLVFLNRSNVDAVLTMDGGPGTMDCLLSHKASINVQPVLRAVEVVHSK
jgi:hypothetical protein